ncbi:MAG: iron-sulfur cluster repair di-iron protein [Cyclobacteriaceae bacterium]|nr:iron-sulfur cluster repair di-iron protein [Cyclobacteriaceae bacterium HetDA_MAG_MS6]
MSVLQRTIKSIVDDNFIYARALHFLGVEFYDYEERTLEEVCKLRGWDRHKILKCFYEFDKQSHFSFRELAECPVELTMEYLRHTHHLFIKDKLPYIAKLIRKMPDMQSEVIDLKTIFPAFVEDFILHIYEEEDQLFTYIDTLLKVQQSKSDSPFSVIYPFRQFSIAEMMAHHVGEDDMAGIRDLIGMISPDSLLGKVVISEIKAFDREVLYHAEIENEILFPKALVIEKEVKENIRYLGTLN